MDSNQSQPHQNEFYYFPSGSTVVFTIRRPSRAYEIYSGYRAWLNGESFQLTEGNPNDWDYIDQKWEYTIPSGSDYQELNFLHTWGTESFIIKSVVLKSDTRSTRGLQSNGLSRNSVKRSAPATRDLVVLTGNPPVSDLPGMMYVVDDEWPSAEEGDINKVVLNSGLWSDVIRDLPPADSHGHKYLYYIESVEEQNVPDGTRVEILFLSTVLMPYDHPTFKSKYNAFGLSLK